MNTTKGLKQIFTLILFLLCFTLRAQTTKDPNARKPGNNETQRKGTPLTVSPDAYRGSHYKEYHHKSFFYRLFHKEPESLEEEYYQRIKRVSKEKKRGAKEMEKPQYSNPLYFGHKKKPKMRPVGKRKMCKECGIVH